MAEFLRVLKEEVCRADGEIKADAAALRKLNECLCGQDEHLGIRYTQMDQELIAAELHISEKHLQPMGLVHGGVYAAMAESLGSIAAYCYSGCTQQVVGVANHTEFLAPVKAGVLSAQAQAVKIGKRTQLVDIEFFHRGHLVARATVRTLAV